MGSDSLRQVERLRGMKCFPGGETQFAGNTMTNREPMKIATNVQ